MEKVQTLKRKTQKGCKKLVKRRKKQISKVKLTGLSDKQLINKATPCFAVDFDRDFIVDSEHDDTLLFLSQLNSKFKYFRFTKNYLIEYSNEYLCSFAKVKNTEAVFNVTVHIDDLIAEKICSDVIEEEKTVGVTTIPGKVMKDLRKYYFSNRRNRYHFKILDIDFLTGYLKLLEGAYDFAMENFSYLKSKKNSLTEDDVNELLLFYEHSCFSVNSYNRLNCNCIWLLVRYIEFYANQQEDLNLDELYNREVKSQYAKSYMTKQNITGKIKKVMNSNTFLKDFSYVELDNETDLKKFNTIQWEYNTFRQQIGLSELTSNPELRFRKLGQHRALGLYYSLLKCICIDIRSPKSFAHEFGHHIDYTYKDKQLSKDIHFLDLCKLYRQLWEKRLCDEKRKISSHAKSYFKNSTEVFARCFVIYLNTLGIESSFLESGEDFSASSGFPILTDNLKKSIVEYFDSILPGIRKSYIEFKENQNKKVTEKVDISLQTINMDTSTRQLSFL